MRRIRSLLAIPIVVGMFLVLFSTPIFAATGILKQINFQGKVVNKTVGTNVADGSYSFTFSLYSVSSSGTAVWTETKSVTVTNGIFQTLLGDTTALPGSLDFNTDNLYLGINFNGDGEMSPRVRLTAVPYAFNALKVAGLTVTDTTGTLTIPNGKTVQFADAFTTSGANPLTLTTTASTNITLPTTGTLATLAGAETFSNKTIASTGLTVEDNTWLGLSSGGGRITFDDQTIDEVILTGRIGINNDTPAAELDISGDTITSGNVYLAQGKGLYWDTNEASLYYDGGMYLNNPSGNTSVGAGQTLSGTTIDFIRSSGTVLGYFITGTTNTGDFAVDTNTLYVDASADAVGIGTTSPVEKLHVYGAGSSIQVQNTTGNSSLKFQTGLVRLESDGDALLTFVNGTVATKVFSNGNIAMGFESTPTFKLELAGNIGPHTTAAYDLGSATNKWNNIYGTTIYQGANQVCDTSGNCGVGGGSGANYWRLNLGTISPVNDTLDFLVGSNATTSAKFAFINVNTGAPTVSISGNLSLAVPTGANPATTYTALNGGTISFRTSLGGDAGATSRLMINNEGNIGIGTTNPTASLDVARTAVTSTAEEIAHFSINDDATSYISIRNGSSTDGLFAPQLRFKGSAANVAGNIQGMITTDTGVNPAWVFTSQLASSAITVRPLIAFRNYTTDVVTILANGNLGIGSATPIAKLDVIGDGRFTGYLSAPGATVSATYAGGKALVVRGGPSGTANITEFQDSTGSPLTVVNQYGHIDLSGTAEPVTFNTILRFNDNVVGTSEVTGGLANGVIALGGQNRTLFNFITDNGVNSLFSGGINGEGYRRFAISGSGIWQVGSGTSAPDSILGRLPTGGLVVQGPTDQPQFSIIGPNGQTGNYLNVTSDAAAAGNVFTILSNGSVGIGINSSLNARLHVKNTANTAGAHFDFTGLTSANGISVSGGTAMTTGNTLFINSPTYLHTAAETGKVANITFNDASTNTTGNSITAGLSVTASVSTSGAGTKQIEGFRFETPTLSACTSGACSVNGVSVNLAANTDADITQTGLKIISAGSSSAGTVMGVNIDNITGGTASETGVRVGSGYDTDIEFADSTPIIKTADGSTLSFTDGTNTLASIKDQGTYAFLNISAKGTSTDPSTCAVGDVYINSADATIKACTGTNSWEALDGGGSGGGPTNLTLVPEYAGATLTANGSATINGSMTSDITSSADGFKNYYQWSSAQTSLQDYTVAVRVKLPSNFSTWATSNAIVINYVTQSTSNLNNKLDIDIRNQDDTPGSSVSTSTTNVSGVAGTWTTVAIDDSAIDDGAAPDWDAAGETAILLLKLYSKDSNYIRIGDITLNYTSN